MIRPGSTTTMGRRQMLVSGLTLAAATSLLPRPAQADTRLNLFAFIVVLVVIYTLLEGTVEVDSQGGRKNKSSFRIGLKGLNIPAKTKLYAFWHSAIFDELVLLGSMKVDKQGGASGKFSLKEFVIPTDEVYIALSNDPTEDDLIFKAVLEEVGAM